MKKSILQRMAEEAVNRSETVEADNAEKLAPTRRHSSPVIVNVGKSLTHLGEDSILSLDPSRIERSPYQDRFNDDQETKIELEALKVSVASEGQKIPVLVRPHPTKPDHYQLAYGHRRLAAIKSLMADSERPETVKIKAYLRNLTDRQLIEEQAVENGVRENLTWIEQAMWAVQLKEAGLSHRAICPVLALSEAAVSHLFRVTSVIPTDIIFAIGRAKSVGRPKWTALAELLKDDSKITAVRKILNIGEFQSKDGAGRIGMAIDIANGLTSAEPNGAPEVVDITLGERLFGRMKNSSSGTTLTIPKKEDGFARWLAERMPELVREYDHQSDRVK
ncbi:MULTISPECIES: plasmid partitioning protein RepB [unclassified Neorhizobium]|uniref:plasmid partitioning protein RepB n=1 Tax=unclassified Neorhizobium TaxID=2629175 RepID=UPI001FF374C0|nr:MULTISPECIES: plasmid partitioning protein RepB [unclassified Neorhizobium]MCJ9670065.1 plasmid partitioning protein RepB [Neorhizobium sp. SHOUNA12B]MCJ9746050.1 plasmid partitioning protein RepB [Neorhizobium sp. SHOUNA12A]